MRRRPFVVVVFAGSSCGNARNSDATRLLRVGKHVFEGDVVLVLYQGSAAWRAVRSSGGSRSAYQTITRVCTRNPNGTVRSTALGRRLRAWPTPSSACRPRWPVRSTSARRSARRCARGRRVGAEQGQVVAGGGVGFADQHRAAGVAPNGPYHRQSICAICTVSVRP